MPFIGTQPEVGGYSVLDNLTASATANYTLQLNSANFVPSSANQLLVSLNGVIQKPGSSFTVSGSTLTFKSGGSDQALTSSDSIDFIIAMGEPLLIGTPSDGTVTTNKLVNDSVTGAKIENNPTIAGNLGVNGITTSTGTIVASSGVAIGGSGAANTLDDYEEGTWTPIITGYTGGNTQTYSSAFGNYVKAGKLVTCTYQVKLSAKGNISGAYVHLKGMPFANLTTAAGSGIIHYVWALGTARDNLTWEVGGGNTDKCWLTYTDGTTTNYVNTSDVGNTTGFMGTLIYFTDA